MLVFFFYTSDSVLQACLISSWFQSFGPPPDHLPIKQSFYDRPCRCLICSPTSWEQFFYSGRAPLFWNSNLVTWNLNLATQNSRIATQNSNLATRNSILNLKWNSYLSRNLDHILFSNVSWHNSLSLLMCRKAVNQLITQLIVGLICRKEACEG